VVIQQLHKARRRFFFVPEIMHALEFTGLRPYRRPAGFDFPVGVQFQIQAQTVVIASLGLNAENVRRRKPGGEKQCRAADVAAQVNNGADLPLRINQRKPVKNVLVFLFHKNLVKHKHVA
ncbi:MAG: hypothetical protein WCJ07_10880, partial [Verrucomicrobiota bacterium]